MSSPFITDFLLQHVTSKFRTPIKRDETMASQTLEDAGSSKLDSVEIPESENLKKKERGENKFLNRFRIFKRKTSQITNQIEELNYYNATAALFKKNSILPAYNLQGKQSTKIEEKKVYILVKEENLSDLKNLKQKSYILNRILKSNELKLNEKKDIFSLLCIYPYYRLTTNMDYWYKKLNWFMKFHDIEMEQPEELLLEEVDYSHAQRLYRRLDEILNIKSKRKRKFFPALYSDDLKLTKKEDLDYRPYTYADDERTDEELRVEEIRYDLQKLYRKKFKKLDKMLQQDIPFWNSLRQTILELYGEFEKKFASTVYYTGFRVRESDINESSLPKQFFEARVGSEAHFQNSFSNSKLEGFKSICPIFLDLETANEFLESTLESSVVYYETTVSGSKKLLDQLSKFRREKFERNSKQKDDFCAELKRVKIKEVLLIDLLDYSIALNYEHSDSNRFEFLIIPNLQKPRLKSNWKKFGIQKLKQNTFKQYVDKTWPKSFQIDESISENIIFNEFVLNQGNNLDISKELIMEKNAL